MFGKARVSILLAVCSVMLLMSALPVSSVLAGDTETLLAGSPERGAAQGNAGGSTASLRLTMGSRLKGIAVDKFRNRAYVAVQGNNAIAIVDGSTSYLVPCGGVAPNGLALSEDGSRLFVVNSGSDQVAVLDVRYGYAVRDTIDVGRNPFGIAIANGTAYVTNHGDGTVTLIDVYRRAAFKTVAVGHHPSLPAAAGNRAYVPNHSKYLGWRSVDPAAEWDYVQRNKGRDTGVSVVYSDGRVEYILGEYVGFFAAAVDETHQRVYITKRDGTAEGLYVLSMYDNRLIKFVPMLRPYAVAVNPQTQHVFVVQGDMDEVYVLDATRDYRMIRALNTDPNNGGDSGMQGGQGIGVRGYDVYVSNYAAGTLTRFADSWGMGYGGWSVPIDTDYIRGWMESGGNHGPLGAPRSSANRYWYSEQQYERGSMQWRQGPAGGNYVFDNESTQPGGTDWTGRDGGVWQWYRPRWASSMPLFPAGCPEAWWPHGPMFGFGVTWCDEPGVKEAIGYPIGPEYGAVGGDQSFAHGMVFWNPTSDAYYVLRMDNMRWHYYRAHRKYNVDELLATVTGQIHLQGRVDHRGVILYSPTGPRAVTDEDGSFGINYEGQMSLRIHYPGYLDIILQFKGDSEVILHMGGIVLVGGDVNDDDQIDILDLAYVGYCFSTADAQADLNGDGVVDILDLSQIGANFGKTGPVVWER